MKLNSAHISNKKSFTLLEVIIVVVVISVIASLALPNLLNMVEKTYRIEAFNNLVSLRRAMDQCLFSRGFDACTCMTQINSDGTLDAFNNSPGAKFQYTVSACVWGGAIDPNHYRYVLQALYIKDVGTSNIYLDYNFINLPYEIKECGTGRWADLGTYFGGRCT